MSINGLTRQEDKSTLEKNPLNFSPYKKFMYALSSHESKRQYPKRLQMFLDFVDIKSSSIEESCNILYEIVRGEKGVEYLETQLLNFFAVQNQRTQRREISTETIKNYYKPIKRFCEMNRVTINWNVISKGIMKVLDIPMIVPQP